MFEPGWYEVEVDHHLYAANEHFNTLAAQRLHKLHPPLLIKLAAGTALQHLSPEEHSVAGVVILQHFQVLLRRTLLTHLHHHTWLHHTWGHLSPSHLLRWAVWIAAPVPATASTISLKLWAGLTISGHLWGGAAILTSTLPPA